MMRTRSTPLRALAALALLFVPVLLSGCSTESKVLARVGDQAITADDFLDVARANPGQYPGRPDSARAALLEDLVKRALLIQEAKVRGLADSVQLANMRRQLEDQLAMRSLLEKLAPRDVPVSDAEAKRLYEWRASEAHLFVIFTPDRRGADAALAELKGGADFSAMADRYNYTGMMPPHGDAGFMTPGSLVPPLDDLLRTAPLGQLIGPVESTGDGWFLVKITERRPRQQEPFEQQKAMLREMLKQRKQKTLMNAAYNRLREQYKVRLESDGPQALFHRFNPNDHRDSLVAAMGGLPVPPPPTPEQLKQVLARYDDRGKAVPYTLADALQDMADPGKPRPDFAMVPMIEQWLESNLVQRVALIEARHRHLGEEPAVQRQVRERVNNMLLDAIYSAEIASILSASEAELRAAFERHPGGFVRLDAAKVMLATFPDSAAAQAVTAHAKPGGTLRDAVNAAAPAAHVMEADIKFPTQDPLWSRLEATIMATGPNEVRGPLRMGAGWLVLQVISKDQGPQTFENLPEQVRLALENEAVQQRREARLNELTAQLRAKFHPQVHPERLKSIPWPVPPAKS
ncbi:MAG: peptidyl-prolyl cis-trans isomerase [Candidatus Eisenbacteria bacterium]|nr:peptidyl-prolyl cis-trans isomerase [Candidatus Eisenbacteria bacterium]